MRILINALAPVSGGHVTYLCNVLPVLGCLDSYNEYVVLRAPWQDFWTFKLPSNVRLVMAPLPPTRSVWRRVVWEQLGIPAFIRKHEIGLLFSIADITSLAAPCPVVLAIRNPNPYLGGNMGRGWRYYLDRKIALWTLTWMSARKAARVIFVSDFSRSVVCQQLKIPRQKAHTIYHGLNPVFRNVSVATPAWVEQLPKPYLLIVSDICAHKNYPFFVRAFVRICQRANFQHHLVIAGATTFQRDVDEMRHIAHEASIQDRLHLLGHVPNNELPALYRRADVFVFPSMLETFGHPLVEAMASGLPVVASSAASIPEVCQDAALYFDPTDLEDAIEKTTWLLADSSLRHNLVRRGLARVADFSYERTVQETLAVFEAVMA